MSLSQIKVDLDAIRSKQRGKARFAQRFVYLMGPADAPRIPLSNFEHDNLLVGGIKQITAWFGRSLALLDYDVFGHPDFEVFGSGVMASPYTPYYIMDDGDLQVRFRPRLLKGLGPGLIWSPPPEPVVPPVQGERCWHSESCRARRRRR
jgi:hypothetical protein